MSTDTNPAQAERSNTPTPKSSPHLFGHQPLAASIQARIDKHIAQCDPAPVDPGLTVGIMGPWGSGKSHLLHAIYQHYRDRQQATLKGDDTSTLTNASSSHASTATTLVVPVLFNAWRYEREPKLIVPLLETLNLALRQIPTCADASASDASASDAEANTPQTNNNASQGRFAKWMGKVKAVARFVPTAIKSFSALGSAELAVTVKGEALTGLLSGMVLPGFVDPSGLEGRLTLKLNPKDAIDTWRAESEARGEKADNASAATNNAAPTILDFEQQLNQLASGQTPDDNGVRLYFLFLVDDLDRCLPESALEMLETIKLFFNIPSCAFVVALDDDVIERGVLHRYRDYLFNTDNAKSNDKGNAAATSLPITGAEYLEKIIQVPVRLSQAHHGDAKRYVRHHFPDLFDPQPEFDDYKKLIAAGPAAHDIANQPDTVVNADTNANDRSEHGKADKKGNAHHRHEQALQALKDQARLKQELLWLFVNAIPPQPRKLQRAAEALQLARNTTPTPTPDAQRLLARLTIWRLFAPELYRYCHREPSRFGMVADWHHMAQQHAADRAWLEGAHTQAEPDSSGLIAQSITTIQGHDRQALLRLRDLIVDSYRQRSEFQLSALFKPIPDALSHSTPESQA